MGTKRLYGVNSSYYIDTCFETVTAKCKCVMSWWIDSPIIHSQCTNLPPSSVTLQLNYLDYGCWSLFHYSD